MFANLIIEQAKNQKASNKDFKQIVKKLDSSEESDDVIDALQ